ncbi:MAG: PilZ domain-containing protein [Gemmatimonadales bacterium]|nr:PilZ domain-containing protein [Gemmatimonadales bacterium]
MTDPVRRPDPDASNRRAHYRIQYPVLDRPGFRAGALEGLVNDCSETGVRVAITGSIPSDLTLAPHDRISGEIRFTHGEVEPVEGEVVRFDRKTLILHLDTGTLPFGRIIKEQRWLRQRYPMRDGR